VAKKQQTEAPPVPVLRPAAPIQKIDPAPPPAAKRLTQAITIQVRLTVDPNGDVVDAEALGVKGDVAAQLARAAIDAGRRWKFTPALLSGHPVLSTTTVQFVFRPAR